MVKILLNRPLRTETTVKPKKPPRKTKSSVKADSASQPNNILLGRPGVVEIILEDDFAAFDQLPKGVREIVASSHTSYSAWHLLRMYEEVSHLSASYVERMFRDQLGENFSEAAYRSYGPNHPQAFAAGKKKPSPDAIWRYLTKEERQMYGCTHPRSYTMLGEGGQIYG